MRMLEQLAQFEERISYPDLTQERRQLLKRNILDTLGCAIGAIGADQMKRIRRHLNEFGGNPLSTFIGGGKSSPDRAAFFNSALVRYLESMDDFLAKDEACHPSDNFGALFAVAEYAKTSGKEFLTSLALAYQIQCRMTATMPIMSSDFNHTTQLAFSITAGVGKLLGLSLSEMENALAIAGANALEVLAVQAEPLSQWNVISSADAASRAISCSFLAQHGITGPRGVFDGPYGLNVIIGEEVQYDWSKEGLDLISHTSIKKYDAEVSAQSVIEGTLELREEEKIQIEDINEISVDVFRNCYEMIGGGEYGSKEEVHTQEQATHNLRYLIAVALIDGEVSPAQFSVERVNKKDVQALLKKVKVRPKITYTLHYPKEMQARIRILLNDGRELEKEKRNYEGFYTHPMTWEHTIEKFNRLTQPYTDSHLRSEIISAIANFESIQITELSLLLSLVKFEERQKSA